VRFEVVVKPYVCESIDMEELYLYGSEALMVFIGLQQ
jgi:hypothetical protein